METTENMDKLPITIKHSDAKNNPEVLEMLVQMPSVYIYSDEQCHQAYWRPNGSGYTNRIGAVGIFTGEDAWKKTKHCGDEKHIEYEEVRDIQEWQK